jgi:hypothetical protein
MYYETFAQAIDGAVAEADSKRVLLARPSDVWSMCQEPLYYTQTRQGHFEIELLKDRPTKKFFHVVIYRMNSGTYELVTYIL